jgi:hypothetical protein
MDTNAHDLPAMPQPPTVPPEVLESVAVSGDLSGLTAAQRLAYYQAVCRSLGLNPLTKPFEYLTLNGKLRLYALRDCADQLRRLHGISIHIVSRERLQDIYVVTARAKDKTGREDESTGAVALGSLKGDALANTLMKAETKAKRRVTLSLAGLGWLDETELATIPGVTVGEPKTQDSPGIAAISSNGASASPPASPGPEGFSPDADKNPPDATRLTADQARTLKALVQQAFGFAEGERCLRYDLGFEPDERLTLRHLCAHVTADQYRALTAAYTAVLQQAGAADVP